MRCTLLTLVLPLVALGYLYGYILVGLLVIVLVLECWLVYLYRWSSRSSVVMTMSVIATYSYELHSHCHGKSTTPALHCIPLCIRHRRLFELSDL